MAAKSTTKSKSTARKPAARKPAASRPAPKSERNCPNCGKLHASSLMPAHEAAELEGVNGALLVPGETYRVHVCEGRFHVQEHKGGDS